MNFLPRAAAARAAVQGAPETATEGDAGRSFSHRVFLGGQAISLLGEGLSVLAVPLLVLQITGSAVASALAAAPRTIGYLFAGLPAGPIVDRLNPWAVLIGVDLVRAAVFLALYVVAVTGHATAWAILTLASVAGAATVFFDTALTIAVHDVFSGRRLIRANSFLELVTQGSIVLGPAAVGVLAMGAGIELALVVTSSTFLVSLATLFVIRRDQRVSSAPARPRLSRGGLRREFREGLSYVRRTRVILALTIVQTVVNLCMAVETLVIFFASRTLGEAAVEASVAVGAGGVGGVLGALGAPPLIARLGRMRVVGFSVALIGVALIAISAAPSVWWLAGANLVLVWATVLPSIAIRTLRQEIVPRELLGRVTSTVRVAFLAVTPVGAVLAGILTGASGGNPRPVFLGAGAAVLVTVGIAWVAELHRHQGGVCRPAPVVPDVP